MERDDILPSLRAKLAETLNAKQAIKRGLLWDSGRKTDGSFAAKQHPYAEEL